MSGEQVNKSNPYSLLLKDFILLILMDDVIVNKKLETNASKRDE